ncbi:hypothetical protein DV735_g4645, partial [Chaetothyriales sp. CBS 134920]
MPHNTDTEGELSSASQSILSGVSARRLKKREIDRRCQRQARERTKARIAHLEGLVESLQHSHGDDRISALMVRLEDTEKERDTIAQALRDIRNALGQSNPLGSQSNPLAFDYPDTSAAMSLPVLTTQGCGHAPAHTPIPTSMPMCTPSSKSNNHCDYSTSGQTDAQSDHWQFAASVLGETLRPETAIIRPEEDLLADDTAVRALLEGWEAVEQQIDLPVSWSIIRKIDTRLFTSSGSVARLAVLLMLHSLIQYHRDPSPERRARVAPWFLAQPARGTEEQSHAISYLAWPGVRQRFGFQPQRYTSNLFWKLLSKSLVINWSYDFKDCFVHRWDTGTFEISPLFRECIGNLRNWQMTRDMFDHFPELRSDIASASPSLTPVCSFLQLQMASFPWPQPDDTEKTLPENTAQFADTSSLWDMQIAPYSIPAFNDLTSSHSWMSPTCVL